MCHFVKEDKKIKEIEKKYAANFEMPELYQPSEMLNAFAHPLLPIITDENPKLIQMYQWGLIPFWAKDDKIKKMTVNARIESLEEKPSFRQSASKRCLIIANGFYEWQWLDEKGKQKQKYLLEIGDGELFCFAGIYSIWKNKESNHFLPTCTIVTTAADELMSKIHNTKKRMPVILTEENKNDWLDGMDLKVFEFPEVALRATAIS